VSAVARLLFLLIFALAALPPSLAGAAPADYAVPNGRYFAQAGGFAVTNEDGVRFWDAFQSLGGVTAVGYPVSRRFSHDGFVTQAMQKAVFQWRPDTRSVSFVNVFDDLSRMGRDDFLMSARSTPRPLPPGWDGGADWTTVVRNRTALLDERPAIRRRYDATPDALLRFGLPTSRIEDMGNHYAVRLQRAVIQEWKVDVPWARAGETTVANGGDILKDAGLISSDAVALDTAGVPAPSDDARVLAEVASIRRAPSEGSSEIARVFRNATLEITGPSAGGWVPVRLWNALIGWMPTSALTTDPFPTQDNQRGGGYRRAIPGTPAPSVPLPVTGWAYPAARFDLLASPGGAPIGSVVPLTPVRLLGYRTDAGQTWLDVQVGDVRGWARPTAVNLVARDPLMPTTAGRPIAAPVSGKGMWATYDLLERVSPEAVVETARANGITHIYLQVGRSNLGFYGAAGLERLLPVAHAAGISVVGWVYPFLKDTTADLFMTLQVARFTTADGHRIDALAADVEESLALDEVQAYGQILRAMVGDDFPLVIATYPPEMDRGKTYPFAIVARTWNVIAPMDYYHRPGRVYSPDEAYGYILRSMQLIREKAGRPVAIAPIGQSYGMQWPNETGPTNPDGDETRAQIRAAREGGAVGISFFEWAHATAQQWREVGAYRW
jgi:hypothetical protein